MLFLQKGCLYWINNNVFIETYRNLWDIYFHVKQSPEIREGDKES